MGIGQSKQLLEIQKRIWVEVMKSPPPIPFEEREQKRLKFRLDSRDRLKESHHYITVLPEHSNSPLTDALLLQELLKILPSLRVIYARSKEGAGVLLLDEYELLDSIEIFLM
jgi:hypothetical protein